MIIPGFKKFFECFSRFQDKLNVEYYNSIILDSDSDSYIYSDSDSD